MIDDSWEYVEKVSYFNLLVRDPGNHAEWFLLKQHFISDKSEDEIDIYHNKCRQTRVLNTGETIYCPACSKEVPDSVLAIAQILEVRTERK
jgi:hypothetical protein